jgi:hypothetical protein
MTDAERKERAIWKLAQAGYRVIRIAGLYLVTRGEIEIASSGRAAYMPSLAALAELANAVYAGHWTSRKMTPSA